ncbi:low temperature requirement protein A [Arthrobacter sp. ISL-5]|nr:low temperature requirement protein A [Arthrobacter sp. ISL-5]
MRRRDPDDRERAATPLELLFDLAFVVAFGQAADQLTHQVVAGHVAVGVSGFSFAILAIASVWVSFTWFSSAFGIDDWAYRAATMIQMVGVVILALGLPDLFHSLEHGGPVDARVMVAGYIVMRATTVLQWIRAAAQDREQRRSAAQHGGLVVVSGGGWLFVAIVMPSVPWFFGVAAVLFLVEISGARVAERFSGELGWNPRHIAERFGLLAIIALGEGVFGTVASVSALVERTGWSADAVIVVIAGVGLTFGLWWMYFMVPYAWVLSRSRATFQPFIYLHFALYAGIVATGAGLHIAAYAIEGEVEFGTFGATLAVIVPVAGFCLTVMGVYAFVQRKFDRLHDWLFAATAAVLVLAVIVAAIGVPIGVTLLLVSVAPVISVIGYETSGWRHQQPALRELASRS